MNPTLTLGEVADLVDGELCGDAVIEIRSVATINAAQPGDLTWITKAKYTKQLETCRASAAIIAPQLRHDHMPVVVCENPELAIARVLERFQLALPHPPVGVHPSAVVGESVELSEGVAVGPYVQLQNGARVGRGSTLHAGVFVGEGTIIGEDCVVWPNVVIRESCLVGNRVTIHPNVTIGADGFGYNFDQGQYQKIAHIGRVRIEDDVEIGANSCIDRAKCGETVIGRGTKIDNLVQIAHNVQVGEHCCIIAQVGIAGSTILGRQVMLAGKVGVKDNITLGDGVQAGACSCIAGNLPEGTIVLGIPAAPKAEFFKQRSALRRLPSAMQQVRELLKRVERLEAANDSKNS